MNERIPDAVIDQNVDQAKDEALATDPPDNQSPTDPPDNQLADKTHGDAIQSHVQCPNCGYFVKLPGVP